MFRFTLAMADAKSKKRRFKKEHAAFLYCRNLTEPELLDLLGHRNSYIRNEAVAELQIQSNADLAARMMELCSSPDYRLRSSAAGVLGSLHISEKEKLEKIVNILSFFALNDSSKEVRRSAIHALGYRYYIELKYRGFILSILARTAKDAEASIRFATTRALSNVSDKKAIPIVEKLLRDQNKHVRDWTAFFLQYSGFDSEEIRSGLVAMLDDEYYDARAEAVRGLAFLRDRRALPALRQELDVNADSIIVSMTDAAANLGDASLLPNLEAWAEIFPDDGHIKTQLRRLQIKVGQAKHNKKSRDG